MCRIFSVLSSYPEGGSTELPSAETIQHNTTVFCIQKLNKCSVVTFGKARRRLVCFLWSHYTASCSSLFFSFLCYADICQMCLYNQNITAAMSVSYSPFNHPGESGWKDHLSEWLHGSRYPCPRWTPMDPGRCVHRPVLHRF